MVAKSLDVIVMLKLLLDSQKQTYAALSQQLGISASEIHAAVRRGIAAGLLDPLSHRPLRKPLADYLLYGVRYAFPAKPGPVSRGMPTAYAAPPMSDEISSEDLPPVWPDPDGTVRGVSIEPLYSSAPKAAKSDARLYELLALVDALRIGRARERNLAEEEIKKRITNANTP